MLTLILSLLFEGDRSGGYKFGLRQDKFYCLQKGMLLLNIIFYEHLSQVHVAPGVPHTARLTLSLSSIINFWENS